MAEGRSTEKDTPEAQIYIFFTGSYRKDEEEGLGLVIFGELLQLSVAEDRTIFANVEMADVTSATFPDATLHPFLQRSVNAFIREPEGH